MQSSYLLIKVVCWSLNWPLDMPDISISTNQYNWLWSWVSLIYVSIICFCSIVLNWLVLIYIYILITSRDEIMRLEISWIPRWIIQDWYTMTSRYLFDIENPTEQVDLPVLLDTSSLDYWLASSSLSNRLSIELLVSRWSAP